MILSLALSLALSLYLSLSLSLYLSLYLSLSLSLTHNPRLPTQPTFAHMPRSPIFPIISLASFLEEVLFFLSLGPFFYDDFSPHVTLAFFLHLNCDFVFAARDHC